MSSFKKRSRKEQRRANYLVENFTKELAIKYNLPESTITEVCRSEFKYVNKVINEGKFESIRLMYLGIFGVSRFRIKYVTENALNKVKENGAEFDKRYPDKKNKKQDQDNKETL